MDTPGNDRRRTPTFVWIYAAAASLALATLVVGIIRLGRGFGDDWTMVAAGALGLVAVAVTWPIASMLGGVGSAEETSGTPTPSSAASSPQMQQMLEVLQSIRDNQLLSDRAKQIAFRGKDLDALRRAIQEDIARQDWDAALKLADLVEHEFGYKAEAERLRTEIRAKCEECTRRMLDDGMAAIDKHTAAEQWNNALREADKLIAAFPDNERIRSLPQEIENRRQSHKRQLVASWHEAVARHDIDGSIEILKQLDTYLTPKEAEGLQETARGIFREKLNSLGKQFASAVQEHRWNDAITVGDRIVRDFPNTRIAQEVREKMDVLRKRAAEPAAAAT